MERIAKYPRTQHLEGSRLQPGDEGLGGVPLQQLRDRTLVVEEKLDGANAAIRFSPAGELLLQSRGHYLTGGHRERHFALFKTWAQARRAELHDLLGHRLVAYGEWLHAKHTVFYDRLPHYFLEFDVLDTDSGEFLSTPRRHALFAGSPIVSVPVLWRGTNPGPQQLEALVAPSLYKSPCWRTRLVAAAAAAGVEPQRAVAETDGHDESEGLYVKSETADSVTGRYKFVRASFLTTVLDSGSHWLDRPIVANQLQDGVDLFGGGGAG